MFTRVLVPTDLSGSAKKNLVCLTRIPGIKEIILQHIVDATHETKRGWTHEPHIANARMQLDEEKDFLEHSGFTVRVIIDVMRSGDIPMKILRTAEREDISLIVMGSRRKGRIKSLLFGSVSDAVVRQGKTHVLIIPNDLAEKFEGPIIDKHCPGLFSRILCPVDVSEPAANIVPLCKDIDKSGTIHLLHVITKGETREEIDAKIASVKTNLEEIKTALTDEGHPVKVHVRLGQKCDEIIAFAEEIDASLILLSSNKKISLKDHFIKNTTAGVVTQTKRPLMVVRALSQ